MHKIYATIIAIIALIAVATILNIYSVGGNQQAISMNSWQRSLVLTDDNIALDVMYTVPENPTQIVVLVHDTKPGVNKTLWFKIGLAPRLPRYDSITVLFDLRFHGGSSPILASGSAKALPASDNYYDDVKAIVKWCKETFKKLPIIIIAYGGSSKYVLEYAVKDPSVKGVVLVNTGPSNLAGLARNYSGRLLVFSNDPRWDDVPGVKRYGVYIGFNAPASIRQEDLDILFNWIKNIGLRR